jgi:hypothetical protein
MRPDLMVGSAVRPVEHARVLHPPGRSAHGPEDSEGRSNGVFDRGGLKVLLGLCRHSLSDGRRVGPSR